MIERFTEEELQILYKELKEAGFGNLRYFKGDILSRTARSVYGGNPYINGKIRTPILAIADELTDNYETRGERTYKKNTIQPEIEETYKTIIKRILEAIKPYYGKMGFRDKNSY